MDRIRQATQLKSVRHSNLWLPILFVLATGGLLFLLISVVSLYQLYYLNRVYPGVLVDDLPVAGMTPAEVAAAVKDRSHQKLTRLLTIQAGDGRWTFTGQELGLTIDAAATADKAYGIGRQGNFLSDLTIQLSLLSAPRHIEPVIRHDGGPLDQVLAQMAREIDTLPQDAHLAIHPEGRVEVVPGQRGRRLHRDGTRALITEAVLNDHRQPVAAIVQEVVPAMTEAEVAVARRQAENLLSQTLTFEMASGEGPRWHLETPTLVDLINVVEQVDSQQKTVLVLELDRAGFEPIFAEVAKAIEVEPRNARLAFDPETEELVVLEESRDGLSLDLEAAYQQVTDLNETLKETPSPVLTLPVIVTPPAISSQDLDSLGIKEVVSESTSYFKGSSQGRVNNIALAASRFHGVVIPPGEIFSFNEHLGEVSKESGFDESLIIFGNRTTVGIGGGVCQVSTTAFRTAFFGGFELVERWAHGYRVGWYETKSGPGLDATVYTPHVDLKFRNDTDYYLLIQTETDKEAGTVTFRFYSTDTGREVTVSEPEITNLVEHGPAIYEEDPSLPSGTTKQVDWAQDGMDVTITRTVKAGDVLVHKDVVSSHYRPWQAVYKVGVEDSEEADEASRQQVGPLD